MDILISTIAVFVAMGCFAAIMTAEWRDNRKRRLAEIKASPRRRNTDS
jgi:hypothetical protein